MNRTMKRGGVAVLLTAVPALAVVLSLQSGPAIANGASNSFECSESPLVSALSKLTAEELSAVVSLPLAVLEESGDQDSSGTSSGGEYYPINVHNLFREMMSELGKPLQYMDVYGNYHDTYRGLIEATPMDPAVKAIWLEGIPQGCF